MRWPLCCLVAVIFAVSGSELSYQSISLACVKLSLFVVIAAASIYMVARDNCCCYICEGVLALNSLVP